MILTQEELEDLRAKFLGKKISIKHENTTGYGVPSRDGLASGICKFIGYNENFPSWELQVTLDRTPLTNVDHKTIKLIC